MFIQEKDRCTDRFRYSGLSVRTNVKQINIMYMKKYLLLAMMVFGVLNSSAQELEAVDSIDVETGIIYPANGSAAVDTASIDTVDAASPPIPQIPLSECDSIVMIDLNGRYAAVYKEGKCGIYDISKAVNVTRIEYPWLSAGFRKEFEGGYYTYFYTAYPDKYGVVGVSEQTNEYICILYPYKEEEDEK